MSNAIEVQSKEVNALLAELQQRLANPEGVLRAIGEDMKERIHQRFATSTGPDGARWQANTQATIMRYLESKDGAFTKKTGRISSKGSQLAAGKKPLIGESGSLSSQIDYSVQNDSLSIGSSMRYAFMQHFGGTKAQFSHLWGNIPARPFFPVMPSGALYPEEEGLLLEQLREYLTVAGDT